MKFCTLPFNQEKKIEGNKIMFSLLMFGQYLFLLISWSSKFVINERYVYESSVEQKKLHLFL